MRKLSKHVYKNILPNINCPCLLIHSEDDTTSVFTNYRITKGRIKSKDIESLIVQRSHHNIFDCDNEKEIIHSSILKFINKNL